MTPANTPAAARITAAAAKILRKQGRQAVTVRAVAAAAGVQAPTIYRTFGDMYGLFASIAALGFGEYLKRRRAVRIDDPVEALRAAWDVHVQFGLDLPGYYLLMYGDPQRIAHCEASDEAWDLLVDDLREAARLGLLLVPIEEAARALHAASMGAALTLIAQPEEERNVDDSRLLREATLAAILSSEPARAGARDTAALAVALRSAIGEKAPLTAGQRAMLLEMLDTLAARREPPPGDAATVREALAE